MELVLGFPTDNLGLIGLIHWTWVADHCVVLLFDKTKKSLKEPVEMVGTSARIANGIS